MPGSEIFLDYGVYGIALSLVGLVTKIWLDHTQFEQTQNEVLQEELKASRALTKDVNDVIRRDVESHTELTNYIRASIDSTEKMRDDFSELLKQAFREKN